MDTGWDTELKRYGLILEFPDDAPADGYRALARWLKRILRDHGVRAKWMAQKPAEQANELAVVTPADQATNTNEGD